VWTPAAYLAKNRKSRINMFEFIYQIRSLCLDRRPRGFLSRDPALVTRITELLADQIHNALARRLRSETSLNESIANTSPYNRNWNPSPECPRPQQSRSDRKAFDVGVLI
jgi:hypothetical protein